MISYENFWKIIKERNITQYKLIYHHEISTSLIHRLKKNKPITTKTIDRLCEIIGCEVGDIISYIPNEKIEPGLTYGSYVASEEEYRTKKDN